MEKKTNLTFLMIIAFIQLQNNVIMKRLNSGQRFDFGHISELQTSNFNFGIIPTGIVLHIEFIENKKQNNNNNRKDITDTQYSGSEAIDFEKNENKIEVNEREIKFNFGTIPAQILDIRFLKGKGEKKYSTSKNIKNKTDKTNNQENRIITITRVDKQQDMEAHLKNKKNIVKDIESVNSNLRTQQQLDFETNFQENKNQKRIIPEFSSLSNDIKTAKIDQIPKPKDLLPKISKTIITSIPEALPSTKTIDKNTVSPQSKINIARENSNLERQRQTDIKTKIQENAAKRFESPLTKPKEIVQNDKISKGLLPKIHKIRNISLPETVPKTKTKVQPTFLPKTIPLQKKVNFKETSPAAKNVHKLKFIPTKKFFIRSKVITLPKKFNTIKLYKTIKTIPSFSFTVQKPLTKLQNQKTMKLSSKIKILKPNQYQNRSKT
jgi:hypothetical protein